MKIGIIAAVQDEIQTIHDDLHFHKSVIHAEREFHLGSYESIELVLVISRIGKVAASITTSILIEKFNVDKIIFTGLAGAVSKDLNRGDVVLGGQTYQHDFDARPLCDKQFEIPLTGRRLFTTNEDDLYFAKSAITNFFNNLSHYVNLDELQRLGITNPTLHIGIIATGDVFVEDVESQKNLTIDDVQAIAVEMEGAAVAQVCAEYHLPYILIRTISDKANDSAHVSWQDFSKVVASHYSSGIVQEILKLLTTASIKEPSFKVQKEMVDA
jgi:adenosylhomocysteine nucleosidase